MTARWKHLFEGEFAGRAKILSGLTLQQVTQVAPGQPHSIYAELWHLVLWQNILVTRDEALYERTWQQGKRYPLTQPTTLGEWDRLVAEYFVGVEEALSWTTTPERLNHETDPGITMADVLHGLAVHNAYHFGKIVAIRQQLGAWEG